MLFTRPASSGKPETVVVLGASPKEERYSNKAVRRLTDSGHTVIPVHPAADLVQGIPVVHELSSIQDKVDTLSLYLAPDIAREQADKIIALHPDRVIMNPGTEDEQLKNRLTEAGITVQIACTLVLLSTHQF